MLLRIATGAKERHDKMAPREPWGVFPAGVRNAGPEKQQLEHRRLMLDRPIAQRAIPARAQLRDVLRPMLIGPN